MPAQLDGVELAGEDAEGDGDEAGDEVPPGRGGLVLGLGPAALDGAAVPEAAEGGGLCDGDDAVALFEEEPDEEGGEGGEAEAKGVEGVGDGEVDLGGRGEVNIMIPEQGE